MKRLLRAGIVIAVIALYVYVGVCVARRCQDKYVARCMEQLSVKDVRWCARNWSGQAFYVGAFWPICFPAELATEALEAK